ncbi:MAG: precorrin-3B C(17)-methyltransferase [Schwartzia sp.]|nr:precorrin-3B C(17)-methyltransferase [Schwartzia sp. (in: firmicutes)]
MGKITVIGIGPGSLDEMTPRARAAIEAADVIAGFTTYIKFIDELIKGREVIGTGMMQEVDRCRLAVKCAAEGKKAVMISSGDAGIYGMAGLVYEIAFGYPQETRPEVEIIAGISAVNAAAAVLGAPLMHDFVVISLSDRLTPWGLIKKRAALAAQGDYVIALYNPKSKSRVKNIDEIHDILMQYKSPETPVGIVRSASRSDERKIITNLRDFTNEEIDMFSIVIIGNSKTFVRDGVMVTPRGYKL